jgi:hypothetical protein
MICSHYLEIRRFRSTTDTDSSLNMLPRQGAQISSRLISPAHTAALSLGPPGRGIDVS